MFAFDPSQKHAGPIQVATPAAGPAQAAQAQIVQPEGEDIFHRLLDIVNPLQHLPVVGTLYRAITGEHIGPLEKIAGDTLYGGMWGAITSVADVAFEEVTGKSVEDTVLAWLKPDTSTAIASAKVQAVQIVAGATLPAADMPRLPTELAATAPDSRDVLALTSALSARGIDGGTASRALYAYRRAMTAPPVFASLN